MLAIFSNFISQTIKFFFLLTPFFALTVFLSATEGIEENKKHKLVFKILFAVLLVGLVLIFFGKWIFAIFGITVSAFRVGAGLLLLINSLNSGKSKWSYSDDEDIAFVPFAIPIIVGPATMGTLVVISADATSKIDVIINVTAFLISAFLVGIMLYLSGYIEKFVGKKILNILTKITSLILISISAQMIIIGTKELFYG